MFTMANVLSAEKRAAVVAALVEGNSLRSASRMTGVARNTVAKLLVDLGRACAIYQDKALRYLPCQRLEVDEIWSFVYAKQRNVPANRKGEFGVGDVWTFTAICADTKLVPSFLIASRDGESATIFMRDLASRLKGRAQLTTDGHKMYLEAVEDAFGADVDFAQLVKIYGSDPEDERRYSPATCLGSECTPIQGLPDPSKVSTSYVERQNLTMRMHIRRFTRLTNAFSKKLENHAAAVALHFCWYNFGRIHGSLRITPAMKAGIARKPWSIQDLLRLLDSTP